MNEADVQYLLNNKADSIYVSSLEDDIIKLESKVSDLQKKIEDLEKKNHDHSLMINQLYGKTSTK